MRLGDEQAGEETLGVSYADALQVYAESLPPSVHVANPRLPTENRYIHPSVQAKILVPATVTASLTTEAQISSSSASLPVRSSQLSTPSTPSSASSISIHSSWNTTSSLHSPYYTTAGGSRTDGSFSFSPVHQSTPRRLCVFGQHTKDLLR